MARPVFSYQFIGRIMRGRSVRRRLATEAHRIAVRARQIEASESPGEEETAARIHTEQGTRPQGRPYARVVSDNPDAEFGTSKTARRRVLGRAAH